MTNVIAIGADHAGYELKDEVGRLLGAHGFEVLDLGTNGPESVDYPDFAAAVGRAVQDGRAWRGVIVCGSGAGACIAANKLHDIRAALAHDTYSAHQSVEHDDANVLCLGARIIGPALAEEIVLSFANAEFSNDERHVRRLDKVRALESTTTEHER
ncbi:MAG: sugar-phosphate isomerase, RpiB/LacA/LacB family [Thermoleophilia bacterium]|nr:sugar-phosphate isomerase, RpiB/LacA/LacB family [Thermoleophilia bacterium]MCZ4496066.1 sugar-phosphate isomerase, RpiB/LacA/LacB family [Thermoleophilia bacterium]